MKINRPVVLAAIVLVVLAAFALGQSKPSNRLSSNASLEQRQKEFVQYVDSVHLPNKELVFEHSGPLCAGKGANKQADCTLSKTFIYKLEGTYRDNGREIFAYLKNKGFDFQKGDKYKNEVEKKLQDPTLDNLSNPEPIIVDIYNTHDSVRLRVSLGARERTIPYASGQALDALSAEQLIVALDFYNP